MHHPTLDLHYQVRSLLDHLHKMAPLPRYRLAVQLWEQLQDVEQQIVNEKRRTVRELRESGMTFVQCADELGVSVPRVQQLERGTSRDNPRPDQVVARLERKLARAQLAAEGKRVPVPKRQPAPKPPPPPKPPTILDDLYTQEAEMSL